MISRRRLLELALPAAALGASPATLRALARPDPQETFRLNIWKHSTQGCCGPWISSLVDHGFKVVMEQTLNPTNLRNDLGIPRKLWSCHTAVMEAYIIEGHVPPSDVQRLLDERPFLNGLAAPDYLDADGVVRTTGTYDVIAFKNDGTTSVFSTHTLGG